MTTATLHADLQRSRFLQFGFAALTRLMPSLRRARATGAGRRAESAAVEAQRVRELAYRYTATDPGFAADLYAAAARHEGRVD